MANVPNKIGKYEIVDLIAKGGMGEVYKGIHPTLKRNVIIKKLTLKGDDQIVQRFNREARLMIDFKNENIVDVYDHFEEEGSFYIVLEYVDGITLDALIKKEGRLSNDLALHIILEISKALDYAHKKSVVHRDVKPSNILISKTGEIKLVDFGIAVSEDESDDDLTTVGMTLGTPSYMAPEQFQNSKNVDKRADIYSLGVILYEMVTGEKPFPSGLTPECISLIQKGKYKKAKKINVEVSRYITYLISNLMHHKSKKRIQTLDKTISTLNKYFKNQKPNYYSEMIAGIIKGSFISYTPIKKKRNFFLPVFITLLVIYGTYFIVDNGYIYEYLVGSKYGLINLRLKVNKTYYKEVDEIYIKSKLFLENNGVLELVNNSNYKYLVNDVLDKNYHIYNTDKIYLPIGFYRLKLIVDGNLFWENFEVKSRNEQKKNFNTKNGQLIELEHRESQPLPFNPVLKVVDHISGADITSTATIFIQNSGKFEKYNPQTMKLKTGQVHYFQFSKKGYFTKDYILKISNDQTDLNLDVALYPKPGKIIINSNVSGLKIILNGQNYYIKGDRSSQKISIPKFKSTPIELDINPGEHNLLLSYKGTEKLIPIVLERDKTINIDVNYNKKSKMLVTN